MESHTTWLIFYNLSARCFCCLAAQVPATVVVQTCQRLRTHTDLLAAVQTCLHTNAGIHMCTRTSICVPTHGRQWLSDRMPLPGIASQLSLTFELQTPFSRNSGAISSTVARSATLHRVSGSHVVSSKTEWSWLHLCGVLKRIMCA